MKTVKIIICCFIAMVYACGNTKSNSQNTVQAAEVAIEKKDSIGKKGTEFFNITLEEALAKAEAEGKYVLINFHTKTCGPCRKMEKEIFPTPECGEYINNHFVPIMIDGEDGGIGQEIAKKYTIYIFPTYLVLSPYGFKEGEILGAKFDVAIFLDMLKTIIHDV